MIVFFIIGTVWANLSCYSIHGTSQANFGKKFVADAIGLQMAAAYIDSTSMPMIFGFIQQQIGIWIMPYYLAFFALLNFIFLELRYRKIANR